MTFTNVWFCDALLQPGFKFYEGYPLPDHKNIEEYVDHIINMPLQDIPEVFGLHSNADISYQVINCLPFLRAGEGRSRNRCYFPEANSLLTIRPSQI